MPKPTNIVFCMCDELRWCEVGCYGHPTIRTPHIDGLAAEGVRFDVGVSNAPVCQPARSMVVAGQHPRTACGDINNRAWLPKEGGWVMPQWPTPGRPQLKQTTVPEHLRINGYTTAAIGKWHIEPRPDDVGFDHYLIPANQHAHSAQWFCEDGGRIFSPPGYSVDFESERVASYLDQRQEDGQPFYLYYNISPPHMPLADAPDRYLNMYSRDDVALRSNADVNTPIPDQTNRFLTYLWDYRYYRDRLPYACALPHEGFDLVDLIRMYMGLVTWVDDTVGRLVHSLKRSGLSENTLVVFTSDHGDNLGSHQKMGKADLLEEAYRIPMIAKGPGITQAKVSGQVASLADWGRTLVSLIGSEAPTHWHGKDLSPILAGTADALEYNEAYIETGNYGCGVRTSNHLLTIPWKSETERQLADSPNAMFDLRLDPFQTQNVIEQTAYSELRRQLEASLRRWDAATPWGESSRIAPPGV